ARGRSHPGRRVARLLSTLASGRGLPGAALGLAANPLPRPRPLLARHHRGPATRAALNPIEVTSWIRTTSIRGIIAADSTNHWTFSPASVTITADEQGGTMLTIFDRDHRCHRRAFLKVGSLGLAGLSLADLLAAKTQAAPTRRVVKDKSVIFLFLHG